MNPLDIPDPFHFLANLKQPRQFVWYKFVPRKRSIYGWVAVAVLLLFVAVPLVVSLDQLQRTFDPAKLRPLWITIIFGALVVVSLVTYLFSLNKLWEDSKWLARYGRIEEANLLWVIEAPGRLVVTYRYWTPDNVEVIKETAIDEDGPYPLAKLSGGDVVPVLYDPSSPAKRSLLWAEAERYVTLRDPSEAKLVHHSQVVSEVTA
jgi:hypothetical protein